MASGAESEGIIDRFDYELKTTPGEVGVIDNFSPGRTKPWHGHPDAVRSHLARGLLLIIGTISVSTAFGTIFHLITIEQAKDLGIALVTPLLGIFAASMGFFFGSEGR